MKNRKINYCIIVILLVTIALSCKKQIDTIPPTATPGGTGVTLTGYVNRQPDGIGFNWNTQLIQNPWTSSTLYTNLLQTVNPGMLRYPGGTTSNYWDFKNDIEFSDINFTSNPNYADGWLDGSKVQGNIISNNNQKYNTINDLKAGYASHPFAITYDLNLITPGKDYYAWKWGRTVNDHPGTTNMTDDWWLMMNDRLQRNLNMLQRATAAGLPVKYIELGNELYASGPGRDYYTLAFPNNGASYFVAAKYFAQKIKAIYPNVQVAAVATNLKDGLDANPRKAGWNDILLDSIARPLIDNLIVHVYCYGKPHAGFNSKSEFYDNLNYFKQTADSSLSYAQPLFTNNWKIWYTEIGNPTQNDEYTYTWGNSLISAYSYFFFLAHPNTDRVLFHQFKNLLDSNSQLNTNGAALIPINQAANGMTKMSSLQFNDIATIPSSSLKLVQGFAFTNGSQTKCTIINLDDVSHTVNLQTVFSATSVSVVSYANASLSSIITPTQQNVTNPTQSIVLPPFSVSLIK